MKKLAVIFCFAFTVLACFGCGGGKSGESGGSEPKDTVSYFLHIDGAKRDFAPGEEFSADGLVVTLSERKNGKVVSDRKLSADEYTLDSSAFDSSALGTYEIKITYSAQNMEVVYVVSVSGDAATELKIEGQRLRFGLGEKFDSGDISVSVELADGSVSKLWDTEYKVDSTLYDGDKEGQYDIKVSAPEYAVSAVYTVYVADRSMPDYNGKLNILSIGNSFSQDSIWYLAHILRSYGYTDVNVVGLMIGGSTLAMHVDNYRNDNAAYEMEYNCNTPWSGEREGFIFDGTMHAHTQNGLRVKHAISEVFGYYDWDAIVIQQQSHMAGQPSSYGADFRYLASSFANSVASKRTRMFWNMTWSYDEDYIYTGNPEFNTYYDNDPEKMRTAIVNAVQKEVVPSPYIDAIIPCGTSVHNMRLREYKMTRDGYHMHMIQGRFTVALTWAAAITGIDPMLCPDSQPPMPVPQSYGTHDDLNAKMPDIRESVAAAIRTPFALTPRQ